MSESTRSKIEKLEKKMSHIKARLAKEKDSFLKWDNDRVLFNLPMNREDR